ncbi:VOC family protein [Enemella evansiae]|nr:VOC family protein [Enemella evansiae]PFG68372.1 putative glyoxalase superfamily protein PhnB [Propionibacteriaceae bacterium ES.041]TDO87724.1 putative glyoxalase superfamily protein PhnB [Enemella evansiae]
MTTTQNTTGNTAPAAAMASLAIANVFVFTNDTEASLGFYRDALGCAIRTDVTNGDFRWVTLTPPAQPNLEITLHNYTGGGAMPMSDGDADALHDLLAKGLLSALIFHVEDVDAVFDHVQSSGAEVLQEPADQFYGVRDCAFRDPVGNMVRFKQDLPADQVPAQPDWQG